MRRWTDRSLAVLVGIALFALLLEAGLRVGGAVFSIDQWRWNRNAAAQAAALSVLCVGDSMTAGEYPRMLGAALEERLSQWDVAVFDMGKPSTNSWFVLEEIEAAIDRWHPQLVVAMMGFNDSGEALPYRLEGSDTELSPHEHLRIYKLLRLARARANGAPSARPPYPETLDAYRQLAEILHPRGIPLVAMQYPTLSSDGLRAALGSTDGVLVVDNRDLFISEADPWQTVYEDHFGGSFGHLNDRGNRQLAAQLAEAIVSWGPLELGP